MNDDQSVLPKLPIQLRIQKDDGRWFNYMVAHVMHYPHVGEYIDPDGHVGLCKVLMVVHGSNAKRADVYVAAPIPESEMRRRELVIRVDDVENAD